MHEDNNRQLVNFLRKTRDTSVEYDDYWIERLVKAVPKGDQTNDAIIKSLECVDDKLLKKNNFCFVHLSLIKEVISDGDAKFWDSEVVRNFVEQFLKRTNVSEPAMMVMNALFSLFLELEKKKFSYKDEDVIEKALQLLRVRIDGMLATTICNYLEKLFGRKYIASWACSIVELLKEINDHSFNSPELRRRLPQILLCDISLISDEQSRELFSMAKNLPTRNEYLRISNNGIVSENFHLCKLLAKLVQQKKVNEKLLFDDQWHCSYIKNEILLQLIAMGRTNLIKDVFDAPDLLLSELVQLAVYIDKHSFLFFFETFFSDSANYFDRGLSLISKERNVSTAVKFIASIEKPSIDVLDVLYSTLELHGMINSLILEALLQKSEDWNIKVMPVLATKFMKQLDSSNWECRDTALNQLTVLAKYGFNDSELAERVTKIAINDAEPYVRSEALTLLKYIGDEKKIRNLAAEILLSESMLAPRIEAAEILLKGLPETENLCLTIIPKMLYDEDVALHRMVIEMCGKLIAHGKNKDLRDLLVKFQEDEVDCYNELNEILYGNNDALLIQEKKDNDSFEYIINVLAQLEEECGKDCYDL